MSGAIVSPERVIAAVSGAGEPCASCAGARAIHALPLASIVLAALASPALASGRAAHPADHGLGLGWLGLLVLAAAAFGAVARRASPARAIVFSLALLVAVFGVETAVHSVHHGLDQAAAASCALLGAGQHEPAVVPAVVDAGARDSISERLCITERAHSCALPPGRSYDGRAPPARPSA